MKVTSSETVGFDWCVYVCASTTCNFSLDFCLSLCHVTVFMLVCVQGVFVLTGGSGGGNASSHTLRIHFHVSHTPSHLIVILVALRSNPLMLMCFWVSGCLFFNCFILALLIITSLQIIVQITVIYWQEMQDLQNGKKKVKSLQNGKGKKREINRM